METSFGAHLPAVITLDDLAAMNGAVRYGQRCELSPEGMPDMTVWAAPQPSSVWLPLTDLLLVVEIMSPASAATDQFVKLDEYAQAGIPRSWLIDRDVAQTVTLHVLKADKSDDVAVKMPLAWLLRTAPADHQLDG